MGCSPLSSRRLLVQSAYRLGIVFVPAILGPVFTAGGGHTMGRSAHLLPRQRYYQRVRRLLFLRAGRPSRDPATLRTFRRAHSRRSRHHFLICPYMSPFVAEIDGFNPTSPTLPPLRSLHPARPGERGTASWPCRNTETLRPARRAPKTVTSRVPSPPEPTMGSARLLLEKMPWSCRSLRLFERSVC